MWTQILKDFSLFREHNKPMGRGNNELTCSGGQFLGWVSCGTKDGMMRASRRRGSRKAAWRRGLLAWLGRARYQSFSWTWFRSLSKQLSPQKCMCHAWQRVQKLFSLMESYLCICASVACTFAVVARKLMPRPMSRRFFSVCFFLGVLLFHV